MRMDIENNVIRFFRCYKGPSQTFIMGLYMNVIETDTGYGK